MICAESLLSYVPPELEQYESAMLWKALRQTCSQHLLTAAIDGHTVKVFAPPLGSSAP